MKQGLAEAYYRKEHTDRRAVLASDSADLLIDALLAGPDFENMAEVHSLERPLLASRFPDS